MRDREDYLKKNITAICEEAFPDNTGVEWILHRFEHRGELTMVEVEPRPDEVGYSRLRLVHSFARGQSPRHNVACYVRENGDWSLLFTSGGFQPGRPAAPGRPGEKMSHTPHRILPYLFAPLGLAFLFMAWHFFDTGIISSEGFSHRGTMTITRFGDPFEFWLTVGVLAFIGASFLIGGLKTAWNAFAANRTG